ncbi:hypothetical protein HDU79_010055 [Rhizoclosmatium sp. JEL0117]|nr:hypothetical protein HDU79_010055 [Rhizoclosmatium sp. JEL0117]
MSSEGDVLPTPLHAAPLPIRVSGGFQCSYVYTYPTPPGEGEGGEASASETCPRVFDSTHAFKLHYYQEHVGVRWQRYHHPNATICEYCGVDSKKNLPRHFILHHVDPALSGVRQIGTQPRHIPTTEDSKIIDVLNLLPAFAGPNHPQCAHCDEAGEKCGKFRPCYQCIRNGHPETCDPEFVAEQPKYEPFVHQRFQVTTVEPPPQHSQQQGEQLPVTQNVLSPVPFIMPKKVIPQVESKKPAQLKKYLKAVPNLRPCPHTKPHIKHQRHVCPWVDPNPENYTMKCEESFALGYKLKVHYYAAHHDVYIQKYHPNTLKSIEHVNGTAIVKCPICQKSMNPEILNEHWILEHVDRALNGYDLDGRRLQDLSESQEVYDKEDTMVLRVLGGLRWKRENGDDGDDSDSEDEIEDVLNCDHDDGCGGMCGWFGGRKKNDAATEAFFTPPKPVEDSNALSIVPSATKIDTNDFDVDLPSMLDELVGREVVNPAAPVDDQIAMELDDILKGLDSSAETSTTVSDHNLNITPPSGSTSASQRGSPVVVPDSLPPSPVVQPPVLSDTTISVKRKRVDDMSESPHQMLLISANNTSNNPSIIAMASEAASIPQSTSAATETRSSLRRGSKSLKVTPPSTNEKERVSADTSRQKMNDPESPHQSATVSPQLEIPVDRAIMNQNTLPTTKLKLLVPEDESSLPSANIPIPLQPPIYDIPAANESISLQHPMASNITLNHQNTNGQPIITEPRHSASTQLECLPCGRTFKRKADYTRHMNNHSADPKTEGQRQNEPGFRCDQCGAKFVRKDGLLRHQRNVCKIVGTRLEVQIPASMEMSPMTAPTARGISGSSSTSSLTSLAHSAAASDT